MSRGPLPVEVSLMHGLRVASDVPLHHGRTTLGAPDVTFVAGPPARVPPETPSGRYIGKLDRQDGAPFRVVVETEAGYLLRFFGIADVLIEHSLETVRYYVDPEGEPTLLPVLLTGAVISVVLMLRGHPVLHASATEYDGRALAFVGASGMGKSTVATAMCVAGARLVTDDVLRFEVTEGVASCRLGATETRLRSAGVDNLGGPVAPSRITPDGRHAAALVPSEVDPLPLHAIVVPYVLRDAHEVQCQRLRPAAALTTLMGFPRVLGWLDPRTNAAHFDALAELVEAVPVYEAVLPWGTPLPPRLAEDLAQAVGFPLAQV